MSDISVQNISRRVNHEHECPQENTSSDKGKKGHHKSDLTIFIIFIALLLDLLAFTMILPLFPSLLEFYKNNDKTDFYQGLSQNVEYFQKLLGAPSKYNSVLFGGFLGSMFSFLQFTTSPILGGLSDVYGRKLILILCTVGTIASYLIWSVSYSFALFVLSRFIGGLSKANISLCMAIITDVSDKKNRGRGMALVGIAFSLGFIFGPMIGAIFAIYSNKTTPTWFTTPANCALILSLVDLIFLTFCLKESLPKEKRAKHLFESLNNAMEYINVISIFKFSAIKSLPKDKMNILRQLGFIYFIYLFIYSGLEFTVTFLMFHNFGYSSLDQAKMFLTIGVIMALLQGSVVRRLPSTKTKKAAVFGLYLIVPSFTLVGLATSDFLLYTGMIIFAISTAFVVTCMTTLASDYGNVDQKGAVLGTFRSLGALARALGPVVGSIAFWWLGSSITYLIGSIFLIYPAICLQKLKIE